MRCPTIIAAAAAFAASSAFAAPAVEKRGFPVGEKSRIHTNLDLGVVFDSNPDRRDFNRELEDVKLQVRPGLLINVPGRSVSFNLGGKLSVEHFFGVADRPGETLVGGDLGVRLALGSERSTLGFEATNNFTRTPTFFDEVGTVSAAEVRFPLWFNTGTANLVLRPGGGALEFRAGYQNRLMLYDNLPDDQLHGIAVEAKLKFLPKTAALFNADLSFYSTDADPALASQVAAQEQRAAPYNVTVGLRGQLTERLAMAAHIGFGDALNFQSGEGFFGVVAEESAQRTVIGRLLVDYAIGQSAAVRVGYDRSVNNTIILRSFISDAISAGFDVAIGDRFGLRGLGRYEFRSFADDQQGNDTGQTQVLTADIRAEYWFLDYVVGGIGYQALVQNSNTVAENNPFLDEYVRHLAIATVGLRY